MKITFPNTALKELVTDALEKWRDGHIHQIPGSHVETGVGFWLVANHDGIYLTHNGNRPKGEGLVIHARECDPDSMPLDQWWEAKRACFGNDHGTVFLEPKPIIAVANNNYDLELEFSDDEIIVNAIKAH